MLLTGFEGYGGRAVNPSEQVAKALDGAMVGGLQVKSLVLPVAYDRLADGIAKAVAELRPRAVVSLGLWPGEPAIRLERVAVNIADFEIPDNAGALKKGPLVEGGPLARASTLPLEAIRTRLIRNGIPARLSGSAGQFLCNALMYHVLAIAEAQQPAPLAGFVHLPYLPRQVADLIADTASEARLELHQRADLASMALELQRQAVQSILETTAEAVA